MLLALHLQDRTIHTLTDFFTTYFGSYVPCTLLLIPLFQPLLFSMLHWLLFFPLMHSSQVRTAQPLALSIRTSTTLHNSPVLLVLSLTTLAFASLFCCSSSFISVVFCSKSLSRLARTCFKTSLKLVQCCNLSSQL